MRYSMSRIGAIRAILFSIAAALMPAPASAHSPYFTQTEKLALPDGRVGTIRLLHGDGILLADPVRAMVLDDQGRPLARSSWSGAMTISCDREHRCRVYDFTQLKRHEPDPASFRAEAGLDLANEDFGPVRGQEGYGFASRRMTPADFILSHAAYVAQNKFFSSVAFVAGAFAIMIALVARLSARSKTAIGTALHYFFVAVGFVLIAPLLALASLATLLLAGMPILLWLLLSSAGAIAAGFMFWWLARTPALANAG